MARVREVTTHTVEDDQDAPVSRTAREPDGSNIAERLIYIIGGVLLTLLGLRVLLSLLGANRSNGFADFIYTVTYPFVAPFFGLFGYEVEYGVSRVEIETIVAIIVYLMLIVLFAKLATINRPRRTEV